MSTRTAIRFICAGALLAWITTGTAAAKPPDRDSQFTFKRSVEVPGATLPAGTYVFRLLRGPSRDLVQVVRDDGRTYAIFFARRNAVKRNIPPGAALRFSDLTPGVPPAVQTWWYPGEQTGYEFVYPAQQRLARAAAARPVPLAIPFEPHLGE